jgi:transcriptional regulator with GAF, ATPase, and Fis domain
MWKKQNGVNGHGGARRASVISTLTRGELNAMLKRHRYNIQATATELHTAWGTLKTRMTDLGIEVPEGMSARRGGWTPEARARLSAAMKQAHAEKGEPWKGSGDKKRVTPSKVNGHARPHALLPVGAREELVRALQANGGSTQLTADAIGLSRTGVLYRMKKLGIPRGPAGTPKAQIVHSARSGRALDART